MNMRDSGQSGDEEITSDAGFAAKIIPVSNCTYLGAHSERTRVTSDYNIRAIYRRGIFVGKVS